MKFGQVLKTEPRPLPLGVIIVQGPTGKGRLGLFGEIGIISRSRLDVDSHTFQFVEDAFGHGSGADHFPPHAVSFIAPFLESTDVFIRANEMLLVFVSQEYIQTRQTREQYDFLLPDNQNDILSVLGRLAFGYFTILLADLRGNLRDDAYPHS